VARVAGNLVAAFAIVCAGASAQAAPAKPCTVPTALPAPPSDRPRETLRIRIMPGLLSANGRLTVSFAPAVATDRVVFRLWPNSPYYVARGARLTVHAVTVDGHAVPVARPDPTTLVVRRPLRAHERTTVSLDWALQLPKTRGLQLHGGRAARLVSFFPELAWNGHGWATEPPVPTDSFWPTSPAADFDARITVPSGLGVLATGEERGDGRWRASGVRDFGLAVGSFRIGTTKIAAPRPIRVTVGVERRSAASLHDFLDYASRSLRFYARTYGDFPWSTYSLAVMADPEGLFGTAYPTIGFFGDQSLVLVPHETAHQWFYSLVGNDQSRDPWISEGLSTWAQTGPESSLASMLATPVPAQVRNRIGQPMTFWSGYDFETLRAGLYVQTAQALASLGSAATVNCALRSFVVRNAYRTAVPRDLLASLRRFVPDAERKLRARGARF
jgi:hypothetical protein